MWSCWPRPPSGEGRRCLPACNPKPAVERDAASPVDAEASVEDAAHPERTEPRAHFPRQSAASAVASRLTQSPPRRGCFHRPPAALPSATTLVAQMPRCGSPLARRPVAADACGALCQPLPLGRLPPCSSVSWIASARRASRQTTATPHQGAPKSAACDRRRATLRGASIAGAPLPKIRSSRHTYRVGPNADATEMPEQCRACAEFTSGARAGERSRRCLRHLDEAELDELLAASRATRHLNARAVTFTQRLLDRVLSGSGISDPGQTNRCSADFSEARFEGLARFTNMTFGPSTTFAEAEFALGADFDGTLFDGLVVFKEAKFTGGAGFDSTIVRGDAMFAGATFAPWDEAMPPLPTWGIGTALASFQGAVFAERADFTEVHFQGRADFRKARFERAASFSSAVFEGWADFDDCQALAKTLAAAYAIGDSARRASELAELAPAAVTLPRDELCRLLRTAARWFRTWRAARHAEAQ